MPLLPSALLALVLAAIGVGWLPAWCLTVLFGLPLAIRATTTKRGSTLPVRESLEAGGVLLSQVAVGLLVARIIR